MCWHHLHDMEHRSLFQPCGEDLFWIQILGNKQVFWGCFLPMRERIPAFVGSDKVDAGTDREMAGISSDLFRLVSGGVQLNSGLSDSRLTTHSCWQTVLVFPHTDGPKNQANIQSVERNHWLQGGNIVMRRSKGQQQQQSVPWPSYKNKIPIKLETYSMSLTHVTGHTVWLKNRLNDDHTARWGGIWQQYLEVATVVFVGSADWVRHFFTPIYKPLKQNGQT